MDNDDTGELDLCPTCGGAGDVADGPTTKHCPNPDCYQGLVRMKGLEE